MSCSILTQFTPCLEVVKQFNRADHWFDFVNLFLVSAASYEASLDCFRQMLTLCLYPFLKTGINSMLVLGYPDIDGVKPL